MGLLVFYGAISVFFSFLCSIIEAVLLSITSSFIGIKKKEGRMYAKSLEKFKSDIDKPLIVILTINTIAHTVGAILVGVQAEKVFGNGNNSIMLVSSGLTLLILIVSEIIPKTIGATYWKELANFTAKTLNILIFPLKYTGILWVLLLTTKLIGKNRHRSVLSREDFHTMTEIAQEEGVFEKSESVVIKNLLTFKEVHAKDIMTPKTVMTIASENTTIQQFFNQHPKLKFSRIPIFQKNTDDITGYILKDILLEELINGKGQNKLKKIKREILITNRNLPIPELFEKFISQKEHVALVVDEYGSVSGLVTMEDVIETLLGLEIMDESDNIADLQQLARKSWEIRAKKIGLIQEKKEGK